MTTRTSHLSSLGRCGMRIMLLATPLLLASSAYADTISVGFQEAGFNGGAITTVGTSSTGNAVVGPLLYGSFTVNDVSAQSRALLGPPGLLNSQNLDISSNTAGTLTIWITAQGLSFTGAQNFASSFAVNALSGTITSVNEYTYFSPTDGLYDAGGQTLLNQAVFNTIGSIGPLHTSGTTSGLYSVTEKYIISDIGGAPGNDNVTIDLSATPLVMGSVPEPGSLLLVGSGLLGFAGLLLRKAKKRTSTLAC